MCIYQINAYITKSLHLIVDYFTRFPVVFTKYDLFFIKWKDLANSVSNLTPDIIEQIQVIKAQMPKVEGKGKKKRIYKSSSSYFIVKYPVLLYN